MLLMVQRGLGIAFAPHSFTRMGLSGLPILVPLKDPAIETHMSLITRKQGDLSLAVQNFIERVLAAQPVLA
jgi:DNA-binding transcriptional LysR family regulator